MTHYLTLKDVTCNNVNGDTFVHHEGTVLSDFEVDDFIKGKIKEGSAWYRSSFEPLTDEQASSYRIKATVVEGDHIVENESVSAPWEDYVGLHPEEVISRMKDAERPEEVEQVKKYERGGMNRQPIVDYIAPVERAPFNGYDAMHVREVLEKLAVLSDRDVQDVLTYEAAHRRRPAIISYERETYEPSGSKSDTSDESGKKETVTA